MFWQSEFFFLEIVIFQNKNAVFDEFKLLYLFLVYWIEINFRVVKKEFIPKCLTGWSLGNLLLTWVLKSPSMAALWPSQHCSYLNKKNIH